MSAYETRDAIRDSRAALLAEHKAALAAWDAERQKYVAEIERLTLQLRARDEASLWQWLRDLLPRRPRT